MSCVRVARTPITPPPGLTVTRENVVSSEALAVIAV
jgi:hypothetical protein